MNKTVINIVIAELYLGDKGLCTYTPIAFVIFSF